MLGIDPKTQNYGGPSVLIHLNLMSLRRAETLHDPFSPNRSCVSRNLCSCDSISGRNYSACAAARAILELDFSWIQQAVPW